VRFVVDGGRVVTPVEVSAEILKALKRNAEDELRSVGGAVITVPAYFDDAQRQATKDAGRLAGLDVLRLLNEPTAAALAYGLEKKRDGLFAVYDLGGGTFDVTVLRLDGGVFQVKSTGGDSALGGDDMDRALAKELLSSMRASETNPEAVRLALDTARQVKHGLTGAAVVDVEVPVVGGGIEKVTVTREAFDALIAPLVERTGVACRRALRDAGIKADELSGVILVGGSTRVPYVRAYVEKLFGKTRSRPTSSRGSRIARGRCCSSTCSRSRSASRPWAASRRRCSPATRPSRPARGRCSRPTPTSRRASISTSSRASASSRPTVDRSRASS
jgi:molecular chaperone HscA